MTPLVLLALLIYLLLMIGVGVWAAKVRTGNTADFFLGGRKLGSLAVALSAVVSGRSSWLILGVAGAAYPDHTTWDPASRYFDPKSSRDDPRWLMVDVDAVRPLDPPITRDELKATPELADMMVLRRGARLSIQPVTDAEAASILALRAIDPAGLG